MTDARIPGVIATISLLLSTLLLFSACSGSGSDVRHHFSVEAVDGIMVATNTGGPKCEGEIFTYEIVREIRADPANEESMLFRPLDLGLDETGNLFIADRGNGRVAMFDLEGKFVRGFGRDGEGPGEFRNVDILEVRDGILSAWDMRLNRTTRFEVDGQMLDVTTVPAARRSVGFDLILGMYLEDEASRRVLVQREGYSSDGTSQYLAAVVDADFDTLWTISTPKIQSRYEISMSTAERIGGMIVPFEYGPMPAMAYRPGYGLLVSDGDRPELTIYDLDGSVSRRIVIDLPPERVSAAEKGRITADLDRRIAEAPDAMRENLQARRENLQFAEVKSFWTNLQVDESGFAWLEVEESDVDRRTMGGILHRIISPEGEYLGITRWPSSRANCWVTHGHLAVWEDDEVTGEPLPVLYRITTAAQEFDYP